MLEDARDRVALESVLCTDELPTRPSRPPQYEKENHALTNIGAMISHPLQVMSHPKPTGHALHEQFSCLPENYSIVAQQ